MYCWYQSPVSFLSPWCVPLSPGDVLMFLSVIIFNTDLPTKRISSRTQYEKMSWRAYWRAPIGRLSTFLKYAAVVLGFSVYRTFFLSSAFFVSARRSPTAADIFCVFSFLTTSVQFILFLLFSSFMNFSGLYPWVLLSPIFLPRFHCCGLSHLFPYGAIWHFALFVWGALRCFLPLIHFLG